LIIISLELEWLFTIMTFLDKQCTEIKHIEKLRIVQVN
jgi:hypothetical protein